MRNNGVTLLFVLGLGVAQGCGGASQKAAPASTLPSAASAAESAERTRLAELKARENEIRELRGQLALAKAEAGELKDSVARSSEFHRETVRIGPTAREVEAAAAAGFIDDSGPRPVLRLYGDGGSGGGLTRWEPTPVASSRGTPPLIIPEAPPGIEARLPIAPLPDAPSFTAQAPGWSASLGGAGAFEPAPSEADGAVALYQGALRAIGDRKLGLALRSLHEFLVKYPNHAYADNALFWKGEVLYAERQYAQALSAYAEALRRYPRGNKAADSLLKMGLCTKRMGNVRLAQSHFEKVQSLYPGTVAARLASEENVR